MNSKYKQAIKLYKTKKLTVDQIAAMIGSTPKSIRTMFWRQGITKEQSALYKDKIKQRQAFIKKQNETYLKLYGYNFNDYKEFQRKGITRIYIEQRRNAKHHKVPFKLRFDDWWHIWKTSKKWNQRGKYKNGYCLSRIDPKKGYTKDNVKIMKLKHIKSFQKSKNKTI